MISADFQWFAAIFDDFQRLLVTFDSFQWILKKNFDNFQWISVICDNCQWLSVISHNFRWILAALEKKIKTFYSAEAFIPVRENEKSNDQEQFESTWHIHSSWLFLALVAFQPSTIHTDRVQTFQRAHAPRPHTHLTVCAELFPIIFFFCCSINDFSSIHPQIQGWQFLHVCVCVCSDKHSVRQEIFCFVLL